MTHYIKVNGQTIKAEVGCSHPDITERNICPTRKGNCETCRHCVASMTYADFLKIREVVK